MTAMPSSGMRVSTQGERTMTSRRSIVLALAALAFACSGGEMPTDVSVAPVNRGNASDAGVSSQARDSEIPPGNCTYTQGFWKNHTDWPVASLVLGGVTYTQAEATAILRTPPRGDATYILIHQVIAAMLNVANGADASSVSATLAEADAWLTASPLGSKPSGVARERGIALASVLDDFNNGTIGPGHCDETTATPTPSPTATMMPTATETPTAIATPTATEEPPPPPV
jgi:hypothetical protein